MGKTSSLKQFDFYTTPESMTTLAICLCYKLAVSLHQLLKPLYGPLLTTW